jgi:hypothetical protein
MLIWICSNEGMVRVNISENDSCLDVDFLFSGKNETEGAREVLVSWMEIVLEILIYESLTVLMTTASSYPTLFITEILDRSISERRAQESKENKDHFGYPSGSYLRWISRQIIENQTCAKLFPFQMPGIVELFPLENLSAQLLQLLTQIQNEIRVYQTWNLSFKMISRIISLIKQFSNDLYFPLNENTAVFSISRSLFSDFIDLINALGPRGLLYLLGVRTTLGSVDVIPPERLIPCPCLNFLTTFRALLISSFNALHTQTAHSTSGKLLFIWNN